MLLSMRKSYIHTNLSDFVRRKALESAEIELMNHATVEISAEKWAEFESWLHAPAQEIPVLKKLSHSTPAWEKNEKDQ